MNAYELANECNTYAESYDWKEQAQAMLRQQADRIAELEKTNQLPVGRYYWESVADYQFMALPSAGTIHYEIDDFPLYAHPVKQLSDERKIEIAKLCFGEELEHIEDVWFVMYADEIIKEITE